MRTQLPQRTRGCCETVAPPMPAGEAGALASLLKALADPTRVQIVHMLASASAPVCVCDLTAAFDLGQPTISHHLAKLRDAGVVVSRKQGLWSFYQLHPRPSATVRKAVALLS